MSMFCLIVSLYLVISSIAILVNRNNKKKGLKGIPIKECLSPFKWLSVLYGFMLKLIIPPHVFEQYVLRMYDGDCSVCVEQGKCIGGKVCGLGCACGCDTIAKMYSPTEEDSGGNWDSIIWSKKKYKKHREEFPVKIEVKYAN